MDQTTDDRLVQLQHQIKNWQPLHPAYSYAPVFCITIGGLCSIIRYYNGWSYEEAGLWINLGFWGGYIMGAVLSVPVTLWSRRNGREFDNVVREFEREREKRCL